MLHPYHKVTHQELLLRRDAGSKCWSGKFQLEVLIELMQLCNFRKALPWCRQTSVEPHSISSIQKVQAMHNSLDCQECTRRYSALSFELRNDHYYAIGLKSWKCCHRTFSSDSPNLNQTCNQHLPVCQHCGPTSTQATTDTEDNLHRMKIRPGFKCFIQDFITSLFIDPTPFLGMRHLTDTTRPARTHTTQDIPMTVAHLC